LPAHFDINIRPMYAYYAVSVQGFRTEPRHTHTHTHTHIKYNNNDKTRRLNI